jgi:anhydro-N-acetylmuramic acid kinase
MRVLGIMSGTSLDSVDYAVCEIASASEIRFVEHWSVGFPKSLKERLHRAARNEATTYEIGDLHHDLGRFYAKGAGKARVELAGLHGQTVFHNPGKATLQIGEAAYLAEELRVPVVSNFRAADIAAGGQGAPLATIFHRHVFAWKGEHVAVNNLGGISNVTSLDWRTGKEPRVLAFDTGPANVLIDLAARHFFKKPFDRNGAFARRGSVSEWHLNTWLKQRYFWLPPPKSTGRELFGEPFFNEALKLKLAPKDLMATLTELTARSIALNYRAHLRTIPKTVILAGGGSQNKFLVERITAALREVDAKIRVQTTAQYGWDPQVIEASAFALLAWLTWHKEPGNIPGTTGANGPRVLGQVTSTVYS